MTKITKLFKDSIAVKELCIAEGFETLTNMGNVISNIIQNGNKVMLCGNGGSAADAQHLAAEMLIRLRPQNNRKGIPAITLAQDVSTITACGNDFTYERLYERTLQSLGVHGDVLICITTSGNSRNVILAMKQARKMNIRVFGFLGCDGGEALKYCDEAFVVPSYNTGRVQESHITAGHALMEYVEDSLIKHKYLVLE